jgi:TRAP-type C4-dicarboxylate transport system permease small subunit
MTLVTRRLGEFTLGLIPVPKWIPMILMVTGLAIFLVALIDDMVQLLRGGKATYIVREEVSEASIPAGAE